MNSEQDQLVEIPFESANSLILDLKLAATHLYLRSAQPSAYVDSLVVIGQSVYSTSPQATDVSKSFKISHSFHHLSLKYANLKLRQYTLRIGQVVHFSGVIDTETPCTEQNRSLYVPHASRTSCSDRSRACSRGSSEGFNGVS